MGRAEEFVHQDKAQQNFMDFVAMMWPSFIGGKHHRMVAEKLEAVARGELKRLIINMPPRHTKSEFASYLFPAWMIGKKPNMKIMQATHTADLSIRFGRKVKNLMETKEYQALFDVRLRSDSKAAYRWETDDGGEYYAAGVGGNIAGRGADLFIVDDPHSEQDAMSPTALENAWDWYTSGPRQRLQPGGAIILVMTRWGENDLTARLLKQAARDPKADQWEVIELPAILDSGAALWPEYWKIEEVLDKIEAKLLETFDSAGMDSCKTEFGTAYASTRSTASVADPETFMNYVVENQEWSLLEKRVAKLAVEQFKAANGDIPPGVNYREERVVNIRRS